jgi:uncharacterized protein (DUF433 family)
MVTALSYPHILHESGQSPCLERWPRVRVSQIAMDHLARAWPAEEIARQYPHLALAEIHSALAYYFDHQEEIDHEIQAEVRQSELAAGLARRSPLAAKLASLAHP